MTVTDDQVAALQAQLAGNPEEHQRLVSQWDDEKAALGYPALVMAACYEAIQRRFAKEGNIASDAEVIEFVGSLRARSEHAARDVDPQIAERWILYSLGKPVSVSDIPKETRFQTQIYILAGLVGDAQFSGDELEAFMIKARGMAERLTK